MRKRRSDETPSGENDLFREQMRDVAPLPDRNRAVLAPRRHAPLPYQHLRDEREALADSLSDRWEPAAEEDANFLRPGLPRETLRKLRRGHWVIQGELDLHGMTREEARTALAEFLAHCRKRGMRCVRIVHGKGLGSPGREPVLKKKVAGWLMQRDEILAFCLARPVDGGEGATVALLKSA